jgi:hypothetical protein
MKLFQLAYACKIYGGFRRFDDSYSAFLKETGGTLDFDNKVHMKALLVWLRLWGCRQFADAHEELAAESIRGWAGRWESKLPGRSAALDRLSDADIEEAADAFADLWRCLASKKTHDGKQQDVRAGPTGAAKILFAARPTVFPPWDAAIRKALRFDGSGPSYGRYLTQVRCQIKQLCAEAAKLGIPAESIPRELGRPGSTLPKLIDEYNWVTATRTVSVRLANGVAGFVVKRLDVTPQRLHSKGGSSSSTAG